MGDTNICICCPRLRACSGELGNISLVSPITKPSKQFTGELTFDWDPSSALAAQQEAAAQQQQAAQRSKGKRGQQQQQH